MARKKTETRFCVATRAGEVLSAHETILEARAAMRDLRGTRSAVAIRVGSKTPGGVWRLL